MGVDGFRTSSSTVWLIPGLYSIFCCAVPTHQRRWGDCLWLSSHGGGSAVPPGLLRSLDLGTTAGRGQPGVTPPKQAHRPGCLPLHPPPLLLRRVPQRPAPCHPRLSPNPSPPHSHSSALQNKHNATMLGFNNNIRTKTSTFLNWDFFLSDSDSQGTEVCKCSLTKHKPGSDGEQSRETRSGNTTQ